MANDEAKQARIISAASELFSVQGFGATTLDMIAKRAGVNVRAVGRLVGDRHDVLVEVLAERSESVVADLVERAAGAPDRTPPLSALIEAAHRLQEAPGASWDSLELEVLARARDDAQMREIGTARIAQRSANVKSISASSREAGGLDPELSDNAVVHLSMALSIGLAMLDPVATHRPTPLEWDAMIARIGAAVAPSEMLLQPEYEVSERWRVRVDIPDRPGGMSRIIRALGALHVYTVSLGVVGHGPGTRTVDLSLIAPPHVSAEVILAAAESAGEHAHITVGSPDAGRDLPARMLDAATFLVKHPEAAPTVAAGVVEADHVEVIAATEGADDRSDVLRLQWTADRHVLLQRDWAPFAGAEQARASALLRLSSAIARAAGVGDASGWIDPVRDSTVWIRLARPEDAQAVAAMHDRCSERSRYQRYFSLTEWRDIQLRRLAGGHRGATLVAMSRDGDIVALGNVFPVAPDEGRAAEIALIVEDEHQGTGVGAALLRRMLQVAPTMGFTHVVAHVLADNAGMKRLLAKTGLSWSTTVESGVASMTAELLDGGSMLDGGLAEGG
jgi:AcrR family transcriptional regulator/RimJ/RimL family protein N-acetyltransferase